MQPRTDFYLRRNGLRWRVYRATVYDDGTVISERAVTPALWRERTAAAICNSLADCYIEAREAQRRTRLPYGELPTININPAAG